MSGKVKKILALGIIALAVFFVATCEKDVSVRPSSSSTTNEVLIQNMSYIPYTITVPVNTLVKWTNRDSANHTVTSNAGDFDSGTLTTNAVFTHRFTAAGSYSYHCRFHADMTGTVIVQ